MELETFEFTAHPDEQFSSVTSSVIFNAAPNKIPCISLKSRDEVM